jgi:serine/threonine protein phosphatase PrpC
MEDAHAAVMDIAGRGVHFFAVYDGHGGAEVAEFCGRHLHSELLSHKEFREGGDIGLACSETFIRMDQKIVGTAAMKEMLDIDEADGGDKWEPQSGCTAVAAVIWGTRVVVANAGDSRCVVCDSSGKAVPLSFDHKPEDEREQARIYAAGAVVEMGRVSSRTTSSALNLTRAIGDLDL